MDLVGGVVGGGNEKETWLLLFEITIWLRQQQHHQQRGKYTLPPKEQNKPHNNFHIGWTISFEMKRKNEAVTPWVSLAQDVSNL